MTEPDEASQFSQLVVVGASAGGIEALSVFVASLPSEFAAPIVIAQHLSPHRFSSLEEILARKAPLPVHTVTSSERLQPGTIYVVPPNRDVSIKDHMVLVHEDDGIGPRPSVDTLFRSAAEAYREDLIAIVLSGTGTDGSAGAREVKQLGGTVIIQNPESASFPGMPLSLSPSVVDISANPDRIGPLLQDLLTGAYQVPPPTEDSQFRSFLDQLREESGIDFSTYKQPTITRRLQRRMAATSQNTLAEYLHYLHRNPEERRRLIASFLIKVTEFFRDPELFNYLREQVLPELIADAKVRGAELRLWSAGCATGEEAYSLAMMVAEYLDEEAPDATVRIFATDLDAEAVAFARRGIYPARALAAVPRPLLNRYFIERDGEHEVKKELRTLLVFGEHDLGQRAPFPRIDLVLCRNVLIYFTAALQRRALQLFAFSLRPGGYLVVGKSESVSPLAEYFAVDQPRLKVFHRVGERALMPQGRLKDAVTVSESVRSQGKRELISASSRSAQDSRNSLKLRTATRSEDVLQGLPVGVVVIDRSYDIVTINGIARRLFGIHSTALGNDFIHLAQHYSSTAFRQAIDRAATGEMVAGVKIETNETPPDAKRTLEISCYSLPGDDEGTEVLIAVVAEDVTDREQLIESRDAAEASLRRLTAANEEVLAANQELTNMIARLRAETEDLLVGSEQIQAATEEVETLNEELQASNEELETLNEELQATVEELNTTNDDLQARTVELQEVAHRSDSALSRLETILASISDAVFVVDDTGAIVLSNRAYETTFGASGAPPILEDDAGKPLPLEQSPQVLAARGEAFDISFTMIDAEGNRRWFEARAHPVPGDEDNLCVVVIRDITERSLRHLQDQWLAIASHELRTPLAALRAFLQLSTRGFPPEGSERARDYLDKAMNQTRRIESLVYQMLDASRFQHGQIALTRSTVDLVPVVQRACEIGQALTVDQTITFKSTQQHLFVDGDGPRLEQVILNLVMNALTHAKPSKTISVRLRRTENQAEITVQDRGPGIPESELIDVFDRFKQGSGISAGLGLGLYIAREIVTGHGGTITVKSPPGKGATFTVAIPLIENEPDEPNS